MAKIEYKVDVAVEATFTLNEVELRALEALASYDHESVLAAIYKNLGTTYVQPHEDGLKSFLKTIGREAPGILANVKEARKALTPKTGEAL